MTRLDSPSRRTVRLPRALRRVALAALALAALPYRAHAVAVSPNALYIDSRTRSGTLTLVNTGTTAEEIELAFAFGYPRSDVNGAVSVDLVPVAPAGEPSAVPWLRAFPRRMRLEPGQRQVVRVLVQPGSTPADGEYWGRITITSRGGTPPVEQRQGQVSLTINVQTVIVAAVNYRQGKVTSGVTVDGATAHATDSTVRLTLDLTRKGNAAYLGRATAQLVDPRGRTVAREMEDLAVYRTIRRVVELPLPRGTTSLAGYTVRYALDTVRPDLPADAPLPAPPVAGVVALPVAGDRAGAH
jgi:P pilus assembly chaperone PapD